MEIIVFRGRRISHESSRRWRRSDQREEAHEHASPAFRVLPGGRTAQWRRLADLFTEDGVYHDLFYGEFAGRPRIAELIDDWFYRTADDFRWDMHSPVNDGEM